MIEPLLLSQRPAPPRIAEGPYGTGLAPVNGSGDAPEVGTGSAKFGVAAITALAAAGGIILFYFDPVRSTFYPRCWFHLVTGLQCPGCGSLRALHQLLHGNLLAALHSNVLAMAAFPLLVIVCIAQVLKQGHGRLLSLPMRTTWLWWGFVLLTAFGILRNLPVEPFTWLAPP